MKFLITLLFLPFTLFAQQDKNNNSISFSTGALTQFGSYSEFYNRGSSFQFNWVHDINPVVSYGFGVVTGNNNINAQEVKRYVRQSNKFRHNNYYIGVIDDLDYKYMSHSAVYASIVLNASLKKCRLSMPLKIGYGLYKSNGYSYHEEVYVGLGNYIIGLYEWQYVIPSGYKSAGIGVSYPIGKHIVANALFEFSHAVLVVELKDMINDRGVGYGELYRKDISNWSLGAGLGVKLGAGK